MSNDKLEEVKNVLLDAVKFHIYRDEMNAALHQSTVRYSPLTDSLIKALELTKQLAKDS